MNIQVKIDGRKIDIPETATVEEVFQKVKEALAPPVLTTPDGIWWEEACGSGGLGLVFNDNKQVLFYQTGIYRVYGTHSQYLVQHLPLVPCRREDFKPGEWAFRTDRDDLSEINEIGHYALILNDNEYHIVNGNQKGTNTCKSRWNHWYRVLPK